MPAQQTPYQAMVQASCWRSPGSCSRRSTLTWTRPPPGERFCSCTAVTTPERTHGQLMANPNLCKRWLSPQLLTACNALAVWEHQLWQLKRLLCACRRCGMLFLPNDDRLAQEAKSIVEDVVAAEGRCKVVHWREVPTDGSVVGRMAKRTQPRIWQVRPWDCGGCAPGSALQRCAAAWLCLGRHSSSCTGKHQQSGRAVWTCRSNPSSTTARS